MLARGQPCAVILTAIDIEYEAVCAHLTGLRREKCSHRMYYHVGNFSIQNQVWKVVTRKTGQGNVRAAVETFHAIQHFDPAIILFVGIAGRLKDVQLGDVVIANEVHYYEPGRANLRNVQIRSQQSQPTPPLLELAQAEAIEKDWLRRLRQLPFSSQPAVWAAPVASGENVVASTGSDIYRFLKEHFSEAVAVEMEGYGFLLAASYHAEVQALLVRGISDRLSGKRRTEADNWPKIAAHHASAFAFELLSKIDMADLRRGEPKTEASTEAVSTAEDAQQASTSETLTDVNHIAAEIQAQESDTQRVHELLPTVAPVTEFLGLLKKHQVKIRKVQSAFIEGRPAFRDQCNRAKQALTELETFTQEHRQYFQASNPSIAFKIRDSGRQIKTLIPLLNNLLHHSSSTQPADSYLTTQTEVHKQLGGLLSTLQQIIDMIEHLA